jgi:hypothetical protein
MKSILIDLDGGLGYWGEAGAFHQRQFFDIIIKYCLKEKVRVYVCSKDKHDFERVWCAGFITKDEQLPAAPDLVLTSDPQYAKRWNGAVVIPAETPHFNEFAALSLAGKILDVIKDRIVLSKPAKEVVKEPPKQEEKKPKEDPANWGFSL